MSPFFRTRKSVPNLSAANRNRLMALLNAPSPFLPRRNPPAAFPPKKASSYRGSVGPQKPDPLQGKAVRPPHPLWLFPAWGDLARYSDRHPVHPPAHPRLSPRGPSSPPCPPAAHGRRHSRDVLPQAGWGGLEMTEGKAALSLLCAGLLKAVKAWNRQWPAMQGIATGRAVAAVSMRKGEPSVISRAFSP